MVSKKFDNSWCRYCGNSSDYQDCEICNGFPWIESLKHEIAHNLDNKGDKNWDDWNNRPKGGDLGYNYKNHYKKPYGFCSLCGEVHEGRCST